MSTLPAIPLTESARGLFEGDRGVLPADARWALTRVLGERTVTAARHGAHLWEALVTHREVIVSRLHDMYLDLYVDPVAQVAFKTQVRPDGQSYRVLVRDASYSREATALLLFLREVHFQRTQAGETEVRVTTEEMTAEMSAFVHHDERNLTRRKAVMDEAITSLVTQTVLVRVDGRTDQFVISPVIEPLLPVAAIRRIEDWLTRPTVLVDDAPDAGLGDGDGGE